MKTYKRLFILFFCTVILFTNFFMCYTTPVFAKPTLDDDGHLHVYNWDDIKDCATDWVMYMASLAGAIFADRDFSKYVQNKESWVDYWTEDNVTISESGTSVTFSKELMTYIKQCIDDYVAENQPFKVEKTYKASLIPASSFGNKAAYDYFKSYFDSDSYKYIVFSAYAAEGRIADITPLIKEGGGFVKFGTFFVDLYDSDWVDCRVDTSSYKIIKDESGNSRIEVGNAEGNYRFDVFYHYSEGRTSFGNQPSLATRDGGNIRVFNTPSDFINYSVGQRKIYYTSNYYDYVPEDLQVSIDDLQKTIDDMQDVIDKLLDQITNNTNESEIEELLRLILEELKNNPGGGGSGGGDVNVDIDLSTTNSLLSKILAKVTQIFEKMNAAVEDAEQTALTKIQESLDEIIVQLKKIKHWTVAGTVIDAADAVADWADLLLGILKDAEEGAGSAVAAIATTVGDSVDLMAQKFPFSVPWDILLFVSLLSAEPKMPYFEIPFNVELSMLDITIDYTMELDFSQLQWLSDLSRLLLSMTYAVGLLKMTAGITSMGKEE